ncbi:MAG: hypothetical protein KA116_12490 [Proteobacteria bacterium]|nr:hypothetical protein [Pseudomonadota bacterium]
MWYLLLSFSTFLLFSINQTFIWKDKILKLKSKDELCAFEAKKFQEIYLKIEKSNQNLRNLIKSCPALLIEPTKSGLKAAQASSKIIVLYQKKLLMDLKIRKEKLMLQRSSESPKFIMARTLRKIPMNPCELPNVLEFIQTEKLNLMSYRENFAGFNILAQKLQWIYANDDVQAL